MKFLFQTLCLLLFFFSSRGQYHVSVYQNGSAAIQLFQPAFLDTTNNYTPKQVFEVLNNSSGYTNSTPISFNNPKVLIGWCLIQVNQPFSGDHLLLSGFVHKSCGLTAYRSSDLGRTFIELPKNINPIAGTFADAVSSGDTVAMSPIKSKSFPPLTHVNYLVTLPNQGKNAKTFILLKLEYSDGFKLADIEFQSFTKAKNRVQPPSSDDWLAFLLLLSGVLTLVYLVMSKEMVYLVFLGIVASEAFSFYIRGQEFRSIGGWIYVQVIVPLALFYALYAMLVWPKRRKGGWLWAWLMLGAIEILLTLFTFLFIRQTNRFLPQEGQIITCVLCLCGLFILNGGILQILKQHWQFKQYTRVLFLLSLPLLLLFFLNLSIVLDKPSMNLILWFEYSYLLICLVVLTCRFWMMRKVAGNDKINQRLLHQREISEKVIKALEEERKRLAKDLHDDLGGNLAAIKLTLQTMPKSPSTEALLQLIDRASSNARNISHNLMPPEFTSTPLHVILETFYQQLNSENGLHFEFIYKLDGGFTLNKEKELIVYRIIMELTQNIIRHAKATEATVQLLYNHHSVQILVEDNGKGLANAQKDCMGLKSVQSRVAFLEGSFHLDTSSKGTTIVIQIPHNSNDESNLTAYC